MKTILVFSLCTSPSKGSEHSVSWNYIMNMSINNRLIVLYGMSGYRIGDFEEMREYLQRQTFPNIEFVEIHSGFNKYIPPNNNPRLYQIDHYIRYKKLHKKAYCIASQLIKTRDIDLVHYLNPIGFKEPGFLWKLNKPYIWGPITAVHNRPLSLYPALSFTELIQVLARRVIHNALFYCNPTLGKVLKRTDVLFCATPRSVQMFSDFYKKESIYLPENGIDFLKRDIPITRRENESLKLIWIGRIDSNKALIILLDALLQVKYPQWELHVVGDGHKSSKCQNHPISKGGKIIYHGWIQRADVRELLLSSHLHVITSLGEGNPTTIWEAMSSLIPTLSLDHCGMSGVICDQCGIKIPIQSYKKTITQIADQINFLIENPDRINQLSKGVLMCSESFMWKKRIEMFENAYDKAIENYENITRK